jgi:hypothetical protein
MRTAEHSLKQVLDAAQIGPSPDHDQEGVIELTAA